jgi:glutathionyl-hydroquinone reductase
MSGFCHRISSQADSKFLPEADRYHLYVSLGCPYAIRTLVVRELKGLQNAITCTVVDWHLRKPEGWNFTDEKPRCTAEPFFGCKYLRELYQMADPNYQDRITVPVLWDKKLNTIVNNQSAEIIEMMNDQFNDFCATPDQAKLDLYPKHLKDAMDAYNKDMDTQLIPFIYRCGMATEQQDYDAAVVTLFKKLDEVDQHLSKTRYTVGSQMTLADVRLFSALISFDWVYHTLFKCNKKRLVDFEHLWGFMRDIYTTGTIADIVDRDHIMSLCYSQPQYNPNGIKAIGPTLDFHQPHCRENLA